MSGLPVILPAYFNFVLSIGLVVFGFPRRLAVRFCAAACNAFFARAERCSGSNRSAWSMVGILGVHAVRIKYGS